MDSNWFNQSNNRRNHRWFHQQSNPLLQKPIQSLAILPYWIKQTSNIGIALIWFIHRIRPHYSYTFNPSGPTSANPNAFCFHNFCTTLFTFVFQFENSVLSAARSDVASNCHTSETASVAGKLSMLRFSSEMSVNEEERSVAKPFSACFNAEISDSLWESEAEGTPRKIVRWSDWRPVDRCSLGVKKLTWITHADHADRFELNGERLVY